MDITAARLEATRALDEFYAPYKRKSGFSLFGCCSIPAFTLLAIPTYILLWTEGSIWRSMALGAGAWLGGSLALFILSMIYDGRITRAAARRFDATFPRETPERALAIEVLRARMVNEEMAAQSLLVNLGELPVEMVQDPAPTVEAELASQLAPLEGPAVMIPIEDDGAAPTPAAPVRPAPPRLRYIPLEPERPPDDDSQ